MSGSSLDGLDVAYCVFTVDNNNKWQFTIKQAECIAFDKSWLQKLKTAPQISGFELSQLNADFGKLLGEMCNNLIKKHGLQVDLIASHGHTVFHEPAKGFSTQIGCGASLHAQTHKTVVSDFRSLDVALGGQGAPIVAITDKLLFADYKYCLNLGGIVNISIKNDNNITAYDICACNQALNFLANQKGLSYDEGGQLAAKGQLIHALFNALNKDVFYEQKPPKSLSNQWVQQVVVNLVKNHNGSIEDKLNTLCHYIAHQISKVVNLPKNQKEQLLVTGGGAFNTFLIDLLKEKCNAQVVIPSSKIVNYKEALAMAFLGVLRMRNQTNVLASVTGAKYDNVGGVINK